MRADWDTVKRVFHEASLLASPARADYLQRACDGDPILRAEVESLLAVDATDAFLETPVLARAASLDEPPLPRAIGPYHAISELGRGGMGAVYLAVRADDAYQKRVAVKLVKRGTDTDDIVRRFRLERQTLARLDHPNIARIVDGGTTSDGRPYFVMDFVDGMPLDMYCDQRRLGVEARLDLFRVVCHSVHYAHQNLVIHRDLKPANILVTGDGVPKLLDFGVAKVMTGDAGDDSADITRVPDRRVTLSHASPEQVRDEVVTTSTDVYSLGVLLYQLLCGAPPYETAGVSTSAAMHAICEHDPRPPSERVDASAAAARGTTPKVLARQLRGDLDRIVLMALRKEPSRRYGSVQELSDDLQRHLRGQTVMARGDSLGYRASTFVRRHPLGMTAVAVATVTLVIGSATTLWQAREAEAKARLADRRFGEVRQLANAFIFDVHDAVARLPGSTAARELLVGRALTYVDRLAAESSDDTALQLELAAAYERIGDVQGNPTNANLGKLDAARASYTKALAIVDRVARETPGAVPAGRLTARLEQRFGDLDMFSGALPSAVAHLQRARALYATDLAGAGGDGTTQLASAIVSIKLGDVLGNPDFPNTGDRQAALREYQQALPLFEGLPESQAGVRLRFLGVVHERLGRIHESLDDRDTALGHYRTSLDYRQAHATAQPTDTEALRNLGIAHEKIAGMLAASGDAAGALASYRTALARYDGLYKADPQNAQAARTLLIGYEHLASALLDTGDAAAANAAYAQALTLATGLVGRAPGQLQPIQDRARLYLARATASGGARVRCDDVGRGQADLRALEAAGFAVPSDLAATLTRALASCP